MISFYIAYFFFCVYYLIFAFTFRTKTFLSFLTQTSTSEGVGTPGEPISTSWYYFKEVCNKELEDTSPKSVS